MDKKYKSENVYINIYINFAFIRPWYREKMGKIFTCFFSFAFIDLTTHTLSLTYSFTHSYTHKHQRRKKKVNLFFFEYFITFYYLFIYSGAKIFVLCVEKGWKCWKSSGKSLKKTQDYNMVEMLGDLENSKQT